MALVLTEYIRKQGYLVHAQVELLKVLESQEVVESCQAVSGQV